MKTSWCSTGARAALQSPPSIGEQAPGYEVRADVKKWGDVIKKAGIRPE